MNLSRVNNVSIRTIKISDAEDYMRLLQCLDGESNFLFFEKDERSGNVEKFSEFINKILAQEKSVVLVAESESEGLVGFICGEVLNINKKSHLMTISMGVLKTYQFGLGRKLLELLLAHARRNNMKRIEAHVMETNKKCLNLTKKFGFEVEGIKKASIKVANRYVNECIIGLIYE
jgi:RimJ/RimL family protein N-acetyltransferase